MKILAVSDEEAKNFYEYYTPGKLDGYDMIIACGDLHVQYLEFLVTMANCPLLYVHGNHDEGWRREPEGCVCIDDELYICKGLRILGLGGSYKYRDGKYMHSERQMRRRIARLYWKIRRAGGVDILVTHAPAYGLNDLDTPAHRGFHCFLWLLEKFSPRFFLHGHVHKNYGMHIPQRTEVGKTVVYNACGYVAFDYDKDGAKKTEA